MTREWFNSVIPGRSAAEGKGIHSAALTGGTAGFPPHKGRETCGAVCEGSGVDSLPLRCAPAGNDTGVTLRVIPGERSEGRGSGAG